jgi:hypothetical protein
VYTLIMNLLFSFNNKNLFWIIFCTLVVLLIFIPGIHTTLANDLDTHGVKITNINVSNSLVGKPNIYRITYTGYLPSACYSPTEPQLSKLGNTYMVSVGKTLLSTGCPLQNTYFVRYVDIELDPFATSNTMYGVNINGTRTSFQTNLHEVTSNSLETIPDVEILKTTLDHNIFGYIHRVNISGKLSGYCYKVLPPVINQIGNTFFVTIKQEKKIGYISCPQEPQDFTLQSNLNSKELSPGKYSVYVNGAHHKTFDVSKDIPEPIKYVPGMIDAKSTHSTDLKIDNTTITAIRVTKQTGGIYTVDISGVKPSNCFIPNLHEIKRSKNTFYIFIESTYLGDSTNCNNAKSPFTKSYTINNSALPIGIYTIVANNEKQLSFEVANSLDKYSLITAILINAGIEPSIAELLTQLLFVK